VTRALKGLVAGAVLCSAAFAATAAGGTGVNPDFALGRSNAVNAVTALSGSTNGTQFHIQNLNTGKSAAGLGIKVAAGRPPLIVNSATKVEHLNADFLDGVNASGFQPRTEQECPNGSAIASITITGDSQCTKSWEVPLSATGIPGSFAGRFIDGTPLDVEFDCHTTTGTTVTFHNLGADSSTLNWMYSRGGPASQVNASGVALTADGTTGAARSIDFVGTHLEGQFIFAEDSVVVAVRIHAVDVATACEFRGTADVATS
jgi:hypothetical protein